MTLVDGSHDYHPCEYDFDALWSQFEEGKDNEEHAETSASSIELSQHQPQPSNSAVELSQNHQLSLASWSSTPTPWASIPAPPPAHSQPSSFDECSPPLTAEVPRIRCSKFEEGKEDNEEHAETSASSIELSQHQSQPSNPAVELSQNHQLSLAPWSSIPAPWSSIPPPWASIPSPWPSIPPPPPPAHSQPLSFDEYSPPLTAEITRTRRRRQQQPRRRIKRKAPKQEPLDENVALPSGFERVLENAATNDSNNSIAADEEWEPPRRRDCRRCETKVMLQTADGQLFNKYFEEEDIRDFARRFKTLRCEYGFSQADVGAALGRRYGSDFSQTTISRFEGLVLSHSNMCKLRPPVEQWLMDIQSAIDNGISLDQLRRACKNGEFWPSESHQQSDVDINNSPTINSNLVPPLRKRRKRTSLDASQRLALDSYFDVNQRPDNAQMSDIAKTLELEFEVVRVWFCNRRQKTRKEIPKVKNEIPDDFDATSSSIS